MSNLYEYLFRTITQYQYPRFHSHNELLQMARMVLKGEMEDIALYKGISLEDRAVIVGTDLYIPAVNGGDKPSVVFRHHDYLDEDYREFLKGFEYGK
jgi:hypothetical protein